MPRFLSVFMVLALALAAFLAEPGTARAQGELDTFRVAGVIAERFDGYVELRDQTASGEARALVEQVNAQRRQIYEKRAQETNVPVSEVGKLYATKITGTAPPGTYFRQPNGSYVQK